MNSSSLFNEQQLLQQRKQEQQQQFKQQQQQQSSLIPSCACNSSSSATDLQACCNLELFQNALKDRWAFWFYSKSSSWGPQLKPLYLVSSSDEFESRLSGMVKPSTVRAKSQLFFMKKGISPDRLDKRNSEGGCWALFIPIDYPNGKELLDQLWYKICRSIANSEFPHDEFICGTAVVMRNTQKEYPIRYDQYGETRFDPSLLNRDRIELWTWEASKVEIQKQIGQFMKEVLDKNDLPLTYRNHQEVMSKKGGETIAYSL